MQLFVCIAGIGILTMPAQMGLQMLGLGAIASILSFIISGASVFAALTPSFLALFAICAVTIIWTLICTVAADCIMNKRDVL